VPYNQGVRQNNFFNRGNESPIITAANAIVKNTNYGSSTNVLAKTDRGNTP
jgi:hypothetical protein